MIVDLSKRWLTDAACAGMDVEVFFWPPTGARYLNNPTDKTREEWRKIKKICAACPVREHCARDYLGETEGIWGGLDPEERRIARAARGAHVRTMTGPQKEQYAELAWRLRQDRQAVDVCRIMGLPLGALHHLVRWHEEHGAKDQPAVPVAVPDGPREKCPYEFPDRHPTNGDSWIWYGRRVIRAYYLGNTADESMYFMRIMSGKSWTTLWVPADDVKVMTAHRRIMTGTRWKRANGGTGSNRPIAHAG